MNQILISGLIGLSNSVLILSVRSQPEEACRQDRLSGDRSIKGLRHCGVDRASPEGSLRAPPEQQDQALPLLIFERQANFCGV